MFNGPSCLVSFFTQHNTHNFKPNSNALTTLPRVVASTWKGCVWWCVCGGGGVHKTRTTKNTRGLGRDFEQHRFHLVRCTSSQRQRQIARSKKPFKKGKILMAETVQLQLVQTSDQLGTVARPRNGRCLAKQRFVIGRRRVRYLAH